MTVAAKPLPASPRAGNRGDAAGTVIAAEAVVRRYRGGRTVGPAGVAVSAGEVVALMGENGAGKSTLLRLLATADVPDSGVIRWWGERSRAMARRWIAYAPDEPCEEEALSVRQTTYFWCRQWIDDRGAARRQVDAALAAFGLAGRADEPVGTLSYGLRRRLGIAQAVCHSPRALFLDEPSAGLDAAGVDAVVAALVEQRDRGDVAVVASNDADFVAACADRVVILTDGAVRESRTVESLRDQTTYARRVLLRFGTTAASGMGIPRQALDVVGLVPGARIIGPGEPQGSVEVGLDDVRALPDLVAAADTAGLTGVEIQRNGLAAALRDRVRATSADGGS